MIGLELIKCVRDAAISLPHIMKICDLIGKMRHSNSFVAIVCGGGFHRVFFRELVIAILDECTSRKLVPIIIDTTRLNALESRLAGLDGLGKALSGILYLPAASSAASRGKVRAFVEKTSRPVIVVDKGNDESFYGLKHVKFSHYDNNKLSSLMRDILNSHVYDENVYWVGHGNTMSRNGKIRYDSYSSKYSGEISCDPANSRDDSYRKSLNYLMSVRDNDKSAAFVCLNDDIALGVDDAAFAYCNSVCVDMKNIKIWSFDCTKSLIERRESGALRFICGGTMQEVSLLARDSLDKIESISFNHCAGSNQLEPRKKILL